MGSRQRLLESARIAEQAELFEDMVKAMKKLVVIACGAKELLAKDERNLLSIAYKNAVGARRSAWRAITVFQQKQEGSLVTLAGEYADKIAAEVRQYCNDVIIIVGKLLDVLEDPSWENNEDKDEQYVFYVKMKGDYYRYISEVLNDEGSDDKSEMIENSRVAYQDAYDRATTKLNPTHPIRLGLALNFSVFHYEIMGSADEACKMAKSSFDDAIGRVDELSETNKDTTLILQLLRDNLTLWSNGEEAN